MLEYSLDGPRVVGRDDCVLAEAEALQGLWTQDQYLAITNACKRLVEFTDGQIEVLPTPTRRHQAVLAFLYRAIFDWTKTHGGEAFFSPLRLRIREGKFREPDVLALLDADDPRNQNAYWLGADLVIEVVSPDNPRRDIHTKRHDYAEAGIPEYWIVNPLDDTITVLALHGDAYAEHGVFIRGDQAEGIILPGFSADVAETFDAGKRP
ncbi:MAG: Uma2 family endonuclease [Gammaproteobacteria bacterium]|nr:Uma2 family endonuclease [Gammaproteobacteria bacterium]